MSKQVQLRGGTTAQTLTFTGAAREVTVDTTKNTVVVHNGSTAGGYPLKRDITVSVNTDAAPALGTVVYNTWYRCTNASITTAPTLTIPAISGTSELFEFWVTFTAPDDVAPVVTNNSGYTLKYNAGDTFIPVTAAVYDLHFIFNGIRLNCEVYGTA